MDEEYIENGSDILEELKNRDKLVLPKNTLDYLLDRQHLIPEEWDKRWVVIFSGTLYARLHEKSRCAAALAWSRIDKRWEKTMIYLDDGKIPDTHRFAMLDVA